MLHATLLNAHKEIKVVALLDSEEKILNVLAKLNDSL